MPQAAKYAQVNIWEEAEISEDEMLSTLPNNQE